MKTNMNLQNEPTVCPTCHATAVEPCQQPKTPECPRDSAHKTA